MTVVPPSFTLVDLPPATEGPSGVFPLHGYVQARELCPDDYVHRLPSGFRVVKVEPYVLRRVARVRVSGTSPTGRHVLDLAAGEEVEVTRLVDENLERA